MSVTHVFAEADVAHQDQPGNLALHGARGLLHDAIVGPGSSGHFVFFVGKAEQITDGTPSE